MDSPNSGMVTYTVLADVRDSEFQNLQEFTKIWGEIRTEIEGFGGDLLGAYAMLGEYDLQFTFEAPDEEVATKIALSIERYGLDARTHKVIAVERLGEIAEDI